MLRLTVVFAVWLASTAFAGDDVERVREAELHRSFGAELDALEQGEACRSGRCPLTETNVRTILPVDGRTEHSFEQHQGRAYPRRNPR